MNESDAPATIRRLLEAINRHDLEGMVACFAPDYRNETPAHPARGFVGNDQVRRNWSAIFDGIPDQHAEIPALVVDGDRVWTEWRMGGVRRDGVPHEMAGVAIFTLGEDGLIAAAHFYLEPVERTTGDVDAAIAREFVTAEARR
jgi:ketosteroid isomerase-like protein